LEQLSELIEIHIRGVVETICLLSEAIQGPIFRGQVQLLERKVNEWDDKTNREKEWDLSEFRMLLECVDELIFGNNATAIVIDNMEQEVARLLWGHPWWRDFG
jgi:hypothetical protein